MSVSRLPRTAIAPVFLAALALVALAVPARAGDGTFTISAVGVGDAPLSVAVADLNNDGNQDVVTANPQRRHGLGAARKRRGRFHGCGGSDGSR